MSTLRDKETRAGGYSTPWAAREPTSADEAMGELPEEAVELPLEAPRMGGYRISGDLEVRSKELEQELAELRARYREADRDRWQARRSARAYKALAKATFVTSSAGLGASIASVVALVLYLCEMVTAPPFVLSIVIAGTVLRLLVDASKAGIDDNFPPAPGERLM